MPGAGADGAGERVARRRRLRRSQLVEVRIDLAVDGAQLHIHVAVIADPDRDRAVDRLETDVAGGVVEIAEDRAVDGTGVDAVGGEVSQGYLAADGAHGQIAADADRLDRAVHRLGGDAARDPEQGDAAAAYLDLGPATQAKGDDGACRHA